MTEHMKISELPLEERPYEKCLAYGPAVLNDAELLAIILRTGTKGKPSILLADEVLKHAKGNQGLLGLHHLSIKQLMEIPGIGQVKAIQLKCIGELSTRISKCFAKEDLCFQTPSSIADYYMEHLRHEEQEMILCIMLDTKNHLIGEAVVSKGTVNASIITPREVYLMAFKYQAVNIILIHNHPSGDATPSKEDILFTKRMKEAGSLLGVTLIDHIIIGDHQYTSLREKGHL